MLKTWAARCLFDLSFTILADKREANQGTLKESSQISGMSSLSDKLVYLLQPHDQYRRYSWQGQPTFSYSWMSWGCTVLRGAALAVAILEDLRLRRVKTMATTHYQNSRLMVLRRPFVQNASMEFDTASLRPTYLLYAGSSGRSNALKIIKRLGLSSVIVELLGRGQQDNIINHH